jgi:Lon-like ATP-dependent protease
MHGQPLPIHCQINVGSADRVDAPGKTGEIAKAAAQNVRASIKKVLKNIGAPNVGYEMHVEYIQAHGGVEGDSASVAIDIALISDFIKQPVTQRFGVTGSLTGDIILAVGGVTEKIRSIMDPGLGMEGACIPWLNKHDIEPLLVNAQAEYVQPADIPGIRIYRGQGRTEPFDIFFCKTKYNAYKVLMGLDKDEVEARMVARSRRDLEFLNHFDPAHRAARAADPSPAKAPLPARSAAGRKRLQQRREKPPQPGERRQIEPLARAVGVLGGGAEGDHVHAREETPDQGALEPGMDRAHGRVAAE